MASWPDPSIIVNPNWNRNFRNTNQLTMTSYGINQGYAFTFGPTSGALQSISVYSDSGNTMDLAVYNNSGIFIGNTGPFATVSGWNTAPASGTLNDPNGVYWFAFNGSHYGGGVYSEQFSWAENGDEVISETFGTWPSPFTLSATGNTTWSMYLTYGPAVAKPKGGTLLSLGVG